MAELADIPGGARVAGAALKACSSHDTVPWQRVVGKAGRDRGRIAIHDPVGAAIQRGMLSKEGIRMSDAGYIDLTAFGWLPSTARSKTQRHENR